jgi:hypothetical protein
MHHPHQSLIIAASPADTCSALSTMAGLHHWWTEDCDGVADSGGTTRFRRNGTPHLMEKQCQGRSITA